MSESVNGWASFIEYTVYAGLHTGYFREGIVNINADDYLWEWIGDTQSYQNKA